MNAVQGDVGKFTQNAQSDGVGGDGVVAVDTIGVVVTDTGGGVVVYGNGEVVAGTVGEVLVV